MIPKVLLVDSDPDTAEMYAVGLRMEGFVAAVAPDTAMALEHLRRGSPDAVVAEVSDAARDDWQIVRWCKETGAGPMPTVILLTGHPRAAIPARASDLGCAAVLTKPCLPETLAQVIRALLEDAPTS